jgi:1-deoxy-D-xylulose-5-phosphate synthase
VNEVRARKFSYNGTTMYDLLKTIDDPSALRRLDRRQLQPLAD